MLTTRQYTDGPWRSNGSLIEGPRMAAVVARVEPPKLGSAARTKDEQHANARLVAASPELLAALLFCVQRDPGLRAHPNVMAAISKASGTGA